MKAARLCPIVIAFAWVLEIPTASSGDLYKIETTHSKIGFKVHQLLGTVSGRFTQFSGTIELDREHPENSSVTTTIQVKSIDTGITKRDRHLCSPEFFNVEKFPQISFKSRSVKQTGSDSADIAGDFTMHGVTKPVTLHVKSLAPIRTNDRITRWQVTTDPLKRSEYALRFSSATETVSGIADDVSINLDIEAERSR